MNMFLRSTLGGLAALAMGWLAVYPATAQDVSGGVQWEAVSDMIADETASRATNEQSQDTYRDPDQVVATSDFTTGSDGVSKSRQSGDVVSIDLVQSGETTIRGKVGDNTRVVRLRGEGALVFNAKSTGNRETNTVLTGSGEQTQRGALGLDRQETISRGSASESLSASGALSARGTGGSRVELSGSISTKANKTERSQ